MTNMTLVSIKSFDQLSDKCHIATVISFICLSHFIKLKTVTRTKRLVTGGQLCSGKAVGGPVVIY